MTCISCDACGDPVPEPEIFVDDHENTVCEACYSAKAFDDPPTCLYCGGPSPLGEFYCDAVCAINAENEGSD